MELFPVLLVEWFWLPIPVTLAFAAWCWFKAYPIFLEARIKDNRSPKSWLYIPSWWKGSITWLASPVSWLLLALSAYTWAAASRHFLPADSSWDVLVFAGSIALLVTLRRGLLRYNYLLQRECYFRDYRRLAYEAHAKGKPPNETELRNLCMWEHQQNMRKAEQSGRLNHYLRVKAKSQKSISVLDDNIPDGA